MTTKKKEESISKPVKLITASQAFNAIGGNVRLKTYVSKKFTGEKSLDEWKEIFKDQKLT